MVDDRSTLQFCASCKRYEGVVNVLLLQDKTNHNTGSRYRRMLLCNATQKGNEEFVERLLEPLDVNRNTTDQDGENCDSGPLIRSILVLVD